ncbi:MAG: hypothetical protein ACIALR_15600 [Blastopirellula sp. JB062]
MAMRLNTIRRSVSLRSALLLLIVIGCAAGCGGPAGPPTGTVHGKVTHQGKPVTIGEITFYSGELGSGITETLDAEGAYQTQLPIPTGQYVVTILPPERPPVDGSLAQSGQQVVKDIPMKYRDPRKSGLTIEVRAGENSFDIEMSQ